MYLANFHVDPFSLGGGFGGYLLVRKDGRAKLLHDNRLPESVEAGHVEERVVVPWYDGQAPARGPRQLALLRRSTPRTTAAHSRSARRPYAADGHPDDRRMRRQQRSR